MKLFRDILEIVLLLAFIAFILLVCYFTIHGARKVKSLGDEASATLTDLRRTIVIAAGAATDLQKGAETWKKQSDAQAKLSTEALKNLNASAISLNSLVTSTNNSLNVSLLPSLSRSINEQNASLLKTQRDVDAAVTVATATLADADKLVASPRLPEAIANLADSSKSVAVATASGAATMEKVQSGVEYEVDQLEKPVKKVKVVFLFILTALGHFFGFA